MRRSPALRYARPSYMPKFVPDSSCVLWLPGQDDPHSATLRDRSGKGNNGTIYGATWTRLPSGLWVQLYDGLDDVTTVTNHASLNMGTGDFTLEVWAKLDLDATTRVAIAKYTEPTGILGYYLQYRNVTGIIRLYMNDATDAYYIDGTTDVRDGTWHHTVGVVDRDTAANCKVLVDGVDDTASRTGTLANVGDLDNTADLTIGRNSQVVLVFFKGYIALVRVYKGVALSDAVLKSHYEQERHLFGV